MAGAGISFLQLGDISLPVLYCCMHFTSLATTIKSRGNFETYPTTFYRGSF